MITGAPQRTSTGDVLKRLLVGRPMASHQIEHTLLPKVLALPVFSSDALSSVAYATEEILRVLLGATAAALAYRYVMPIAIAIATLMLIVVASYRQTVRAYPNGGGEPGDAARAGCGGGTPHRLRPDGLGLGGGRRLRADLGGHRVAVLPD